MIDLWFSPLHLLSISEILSHAVWYKFTISEENTALIFRVED
jgi:hypothetical protein